MGDIGGGENLLRERYNILIIFGLISLIGTGIWLYNQILEYEDLEYLFHHGMITTKQLNRATTYLFIGPIILILGSIGLILGSTIKRYNLSEIEPSETMSENSENFQDVIPASYFFSTSSLSKQSGSTEYLERFHRLRKIHNILLIISGLYYIVFNFLSLKLYIYLYDFLGLQSEVVSLIRNGINFLNATILISAAIVATLIPNKYNAILTATVVMLFMVYMVSPNIYISSTVFGLKFIGIAWIGHELVSSSSLKFLKIIAYLTIGMCIVYFFVYVSYNYYLFWYIENYLAPPPYELPPVIHYLQFAQHYLFYGVNVLLGVVFLTRIFTCELLEK